MENPINLDDESYDDVNESQKQKPQVGDKRKSNFWDHYEDVKDPITGKIIQTICKYCSRPLTVTTKNGTSSLRKHILTCSKYPPNVDKKQMKISTFRTSQSDATTISNCQFDQNAVRLALARMVIVDEEPFSIVEHEGFRFFCSVAVPQFSIPSRFTVARDCTKLFLSEREALRNTFKSLNSRVALTTDCWTSVQNFNYICLTSHFIDDNWRLHKRILNFRLMDSHKGKEIGKVVESCLLEWGIEDKLSCLTVDNASSNDVAVAHVKENLSEKLVLGGEFFHMRCAAHILNLIVKDGLNMTKDSINSIRGVVKYVRSSPARSKLFDECALKSKIKCKGSVCLDVATRWNYTYIMLDLALKFEKAFKRMKTDDSDFVNELKDGFPSDKDWENAKVLSLCLKQFYNATKRISGSLYVTANMHFHEILGVLASLLELKEDDDPNISRMGDQMRIF